MTGDFDFGVGDWLWRDSSKRCLIFNELNADRFFKFCKINEFE
jgi:hypothetical protein